MCLNQQLSENVGWNTLAFTFNTRKELIRLWYYANEPCVYYNQLFKLIFHAYRGKHFKEIYTRTQQFSGEAQPETMLTALINVWELHLHAQMFSLYLDY